MSEARTLGGSTVIPCLQYRDAPRAIDWLNKVFGFEPHLVVEGEPGKIVHAQLSLGAGMIMLGSVVDSPYGRTLVQPHEVNGLETQTPYVVVADADRVYEAAQQHGAQIVIEIHDEEYGGRGFACRDPEGHFWYVGTYDPWADTEG
jgi:uncharacterized glyoxalase superfamily protein PhnB